MRITKKLSPNDVGETGGHQAGILVPKADEILSFFPSLPATEKNPRIVLVFRELPSLATWQFNFIYYNNKLTDPNGTRNEYRLTGMTQYLRSSAAAVGDELEFTRDENGSYQIRLLRGNTAYSSDHAGVLVLRSGWMIINR